MNSTVRVQKHRANKRSQGLSLRAKNPAAARLDLIISAEVKQILSDISVTTGATFRKILERLILTTAVAPCETVTPAETITVISDTVKIPIEAVTPDATSSSISEDVTTGETIESQVLARITDGKLQVRGTAPAIIRELFSGDCRQAIRKVYTFRDWNAKTATGHLLKDFKNKIDGLLSHEGKRQKNQ